MVHEPDWKGNAPFHLANKIVLLGDEVDNGKS